MKTCFLLLTLCTAATLASPSSAADPQREAAVARRGADVMPFSVKATTHIFTKTDQGGVQRVVAKDPADTPQVKLVRDHLQDLQHQFLQGDFSGPTHIHGAAMPGLATLKAAKPGQVAIENRDVEAGAELRYETADPKLVQALHQWFDAQVADHGRDAMAGHAQHHKHGSMMKP